MNVMKIEKETAKKLYPESPSWFREQLEEAFGKECFRKKDFGEIKTFEDACNELENLTPIRNDEAPDEIAYKKLKIIVAAINQGWIPDWANTDQRKWYPWFNLSSGFGFSCTYYDCVYSVADVGSRLCFESEEKAGYAGNQFLELYKDFLT